MPEKLLWAIILLLLVIYSCQNNSTSIQNNNTDTTSKKLKYAQRFNISTSNNIFQIEVYNPWQSASNVTFKYDFSSDLNQPENVISTPLKRIICLSTSHIGFLSLLNEQNSIVGISGIKFVTDSLTCELIKKNKIIDVGYEETLNYELILSLKPDVIFAYGVESQKVGYVTKLEELGLKVIYIAEYLEKSPLAKAEWLKLFGIIFNKENISDSLFSSIDSEYNQIKKTALSYSEKPIVFAGLPWKDTWYVSNGKSNLAQLVNDAGGTYLWKEDTTHDILPLNLEMVYSKAVNADYWINTGTTNSLSEISNMDQRLTLFKAYSEKKIFNNNSRSNANGGNDYWESGIVKPQLILKDLVEIFHPGTFPNYSPYFYKKLK